MRDGQQAVEGVHGQWLEEVWIELPSCRLVSGVPQLARVNDQQGNVAEHMALPNQPEELGSRGGFGEPEMKGSWFIFAAYDALLDDCRWRCPSWHDNEGKNHSNYHLGFRCCKDVTPAKPPVR